MALSIVSPPFSFIQFDESDTIQSCNFTDTEMCLPIYDEDDAWFQFVIQTDTTEEADALCTLNNDDVTVGIALACLDSDLLTFSEKPERFRLSDTQVLFNWQNGLSLFDTIISVGQCFHIKINVDIYSFCSNCLQRISDDCHTSVIEYGSDDDSFGFAYCNGTAIDENADSCDPTIVQFINKSTLLIPYTASLSAKYGDMPSVKVWIYNEDGLLTEMGVSVIFDAYPPSQISFDFGGSASGIIKIM